MKTYAYRVALLLTLALLSTAPAQAALNTYNFSGSLDSGALIGETFSGQFSFDDAMLTGMNSEYLGVNTLNLNFYNHSYTQANAAAATEVAFMDGSFLGLSFAVDSSYPQFAFIPGFFDKTEAYFAYQPSLGTAGYGSVTYMLAPVPEPEIYTLMLAGMALMGFVARRKASQT